MVKIRDKIISKSLNPFLFAVMYAILSVLSTGISVLLEKSLIQSTNVLYKGEFYEVHPFVENYSTILDFLVFNPLVIYFLITALRNSLEVSKIKKWNLYKSYYHLVGVFLISIILAFSSMNLYYKNFLEGTHFDALIRPLNTNEVGVTVAGWIVFIWTAIFIFILLFSTSLLFIYILKISRLTSSEIYYDPSNPDGSGGQKVLIKPIINYSYGVIVMLIIFVVFALHDYISNNIDESIRLVSSVIYLIVLIIFLVMPLYKLHRLMLIKRDDFTSKMKSKVDTFYKYFSESTYKEQIYNESMIENDINKLDYIGKYQSLLDSLPIYPITKKEIIFPLIGILISVFQIVFELMTKFNK